MISDPHESSVTRLIDEHAKCVARIAELEKALRDLLEHDDERFKFEGEPSKIEVRCRRVLNDRGRR